ncbi:DUF3858 domain-containing protein [Ferruginibacter paludis]|uniref:DUF3858 domain-containing protein n=1 Tax=Ferruginibacter paludis TaxID=1310417 RepID=UPI0025B4422C|nr:DUF3858 domain-containing protein [Ferruginibacter paludis]MDN3655033.1 DUF3858 domain-containing protein [Ferruginibacter paludis]
MKRCPVLLLAVVLLCSKLYAQDKPGIKFNHVLPTDFNIDNLKVDTSYGAVIIADIGSSSFDGNNKGWFSLIYKHQRRIKIINKKGFDLASVEIPLYISTKTNSEERLESLKASTYNLENGVVTETKLDKDAVFKDKQDKNHIVRKFTMPALKEGSIIEYSYTINSDFLFNLQEWVFQGSYPRVWSEYNLDLPNFFEYVFLSQGYNPFDIKKSDTRTTTYSVREQGEGMRTETYTIPATNTSTRWVMKNVPAMKEEKFLTSLDNHISKIEFQMSGQQFPNMPYHDIMGNWHTVSDALLKDEDFGERLDKDNGWLNDDMKAIKAGTTDNLEEAKKIYAFVKNSFKCNGRHGIYLTTGMKETFKNKNGSVADVNLLLTAMLRHEGMQANPVILSTRSNGFTNEIYPLINRYNYVICRLDIDGKRYFLDASEPYLGFNKLPENCYNGAARTINKEVEPVYFFADSLRESKFTNVMLFNDETKAGKWSGSLTTILGYYESSNIRDKFIDNGKEAFEKKLKESYSGDFSIDDIKYEDEKDGEKSIRMSHNITIDGDNSSNIIYFNPMLKEGYKENFFTAAERKYPVEMPYKMDETYNFQIEIPKGYAVDEIPKSAKVSLNDGEGFFEYLVSKTDESVMLRSRVKLEKATFLPEDYETLRNFFDYIVKKHAEQIVFKKK